MCRLLKQSYKPKVLNNDCIKWIDGNPRSREAIWRYTPVHDRQVGNGSDWGCNGAWEERQRESEEGRRQMHDPSRWKRGWSRRPMNRRKRPLLFYMYREDTYMEIKCHCLRICLVVYQISCSVIKDSYESDRRWSVPENRLWNLGTYIRQPRTARKCRCPTLPVPEFLATIPIW